MLEIELKAHVKNREKLIEKLKTFAVYEQTVLREDSYFRFFFGEKPDENARHISARIRKETKETESGKTITYYLTYKKKEIRQNGNGASSEINQENECMVSDPAPLEILLRDTGYVPALKKKKHVIDYSLETEIGKAEFELCSVEYLGDFLEIEILSKDENPEHVKKVQDKLKELLLKSGLELSDIEERYYSEMLSEIGKTCR